MHSIPGCYSVSSGHQETSEALRTVSFYALLLPSASLRMVLAYAHTYVHTCRPSYTFTVARPGHALFSTCSVTCFVVAFSWLINRHMVLSQLHDFSVLNSHSTFCALVVFPFTSSLLKRVKPQIQYHLSRPLSHLSIHPCRDSRHGLDLFQLSSRDMGSVFHWKKLED